MSFSAWPPPAGSPSTTISAGPAGFSSPGVSLKRPIDVGLGKVEIAVSQLETGTARVAEPLGDDVGFPVAVRIAEADDAARLPGLPVRRSGTAAQDDVDVAVRVDDDVTAFADALMDDERTKSGRQRKAAVVCITRWQTACAAQRDGTNRATRLSITSARIKRFMGLLST